MWDSLNTLPRGPTEKEDIELGSTNRDANGSQIKKKLKKKEKKEKGRAHLIQHKTP
jgi:hypothetical protein